MATNNISTKGKRNCLKPFGEISRDSIGTKISFIVYSHLHFVNSEGNLRLLSFTLLQQLLVPLQITLFILLLVFSCQGG